MGKIERESLLITSYSAGYSFSSVALDEAPLVHSSS
jgi:hypothetical protein